MPLLSLPIELIDKAVGHLDVDALVAAAKACRRLRQCARTWPAFTSIPQFQQELGIPSFLVAPLAPDGAAWMSPWRIVVRSTDSRYPMDVATKINAACMSVFSFAYEVDIDFEHIHNRDARMLLELFTIGSPVLSSVKLRGVSPGLVSSVGPFYHFPRVANLALDLEPRSGPHVFTAIQKLQSAFRSPRTALIAFNDLSGDVDVDDCQPDITVFIANFYTSEVIDHIVKVFQLQNTPCFDVCITDDDQPVALDWFFPNIPSGVCLRYLEDSIQLYVFTSAAGVDSTLWDPSDDGFRGHCNMFLEQQTGYFRHCILPEGLRVPWTLVGLPEHLRALHIDLCLWPNTPGTHLLPQLRALCLGIASNDLDPIPSSGQLQVPSLTHLALQSSAVLQHPPRVELSRVHVQQFASQLLQLGRQSLRVILLHEIYVQPEYTHASMPPWIIALIQAQDTGSRSLDAWLDYLAWPDSPNRAFHDLQ